MSWQLGYHTETADTAITDVIPPMPRRKVSVSAFGYRVAGTAHTLTFMKAVGKTTNSAAAAAAQKDITLTSINMGFDGSGDAEDLAASDWLVWKDTNGVYKTDIIASIVTATKVVTMTSNLPTAIDVDSPVWAMYEVGRSVHHVFSPGVSALFAARADRLVVSGITAQDANHTSSIRRGDGDPILFHSTNATAAGFLEYMVGEYVD